MASLELHPLNPGRGAPFFIAAGVLKLPEQLEPFIRAEDPLSMPVLTLGSFTLPVSAGNASSEHPVDFVYYEDRGMAGNARGLPGGGIEGMRALAPSIRRLSMAGIKTIISVTNMPHQTALDVIPDMVEAAAELEPTAVEVNLSCPNGLDATGALHPPLCNDVDTSGEVMETARDRVGREVCLGSKDAPHAKSLTRNVDILAVQRLVVALNPLVDFFTGINTFGNQPFPEITSTKGKGGMSGPVVLPIARQWLQAVQANASEGVVILSCGGVDTANLRTESAVRQDLGALLIGGAQEFYRTGQPHATAMNWAGQLRR